MKNKLILALVVLLVAVSVLAVSAQDATTVDDDALSIDSSDDAVYQDGDGSGEVKEVWIDQTVDNSKVNFNGELIIIDHSGSTLLVVPLSNSTNAKFSTIDSDAKNLEIQTVNNALNYAKKLLNFKSSKFVRGYSTNVTKVYDYRKYETIEDGDAVVIGDADYLNGAYGLNDAYTLTHLATGDYGRIMNLTGNYVAEADFDETEDDPVEPAVNNTTNDTNNTNANTTNTTNNVNASDKNVTNKAPIKPEDVAKETGIPFAALIVALLSAGILIRRRR